MWEFAEEIQGWAFYNCLWWWLEVLRSIRRTVKTGGAPGNKHSAGAEFIFLRFMKLSPLWITWEMWGNNDDSLMFRVFWKASRIPCDWTPDYFRYFSWFLQISHITSFVFRLNSHFCGFIDDPEAPKFIQIISSFNSWIMTRSGNPDEKWLAGMSLVLILAVPR